VDSLRLSVIDPSGEKKIFIEVPDNILVQHLANLLAAQMGLPDRGSDGYTLQYTLTRFENGNTAEIELTRNASLKNARVKHHDVLRLVHVKNLHANRFACFIPGTQVSLANGTRLPIEQLSPGAKILSFDTINKAICDGVVGENITAMADEHLVINDCLRVTASHLLYANSRWKPAGSLVVGDDLLSENGFPWRVERIERVTERGIVYNLHLANPEHTFFAEGLLVHNQFAKTMQGDRPKKTPPDAKRKDISARLESDDRRKLAGEIADAIEARFLIKVIDQIKTTWKEREAAQGTLLVKPVFGLPAEDNQYQCDTFMIMPFSQQFQSIYVDYIKPVVESFSLKMRRGDDFFTDRNIIDEIWSAIARCRFVIADCTGRNANVFYELGISHTLGKPTILLAQTLSDLPFDIQGRRAIIYEDRSGGLKVLQAKLKEAIEVIISVDNI
jgi:hypothetical protein